MSAWLFTILRNLFRSEYRKGRREVEDADGRHVDSLKSPPQQHSRLEFEEFRVALAKLPPDQREALILVGASGFSHEEAAAICESAVGTIKSRVHRARTRLVQLHLTADLASRHGCAETFPDHDMRVLVKCNMPALAPMLLRLHPACHVSPAPFTHAITLPIGTASCSSGLSPRVHFVERERKPLGPSAASPRDMLAQIANESCGAGHVRFRNIVGAVVDMPMRSDLPAANAFLRDHLRVSLAGKKFRQPSPIRADMIFGKDK
jgi:RNA polymerase sigma-70 factor (ECF subfamily)